MPGQFQPGSALGGWQQVFAYIAAHNVGFNSFLACLLTELLPAVGAQEQGDFVEASWSGYGSQGMQTGSTAWESFGLPYSYDLEGILAPSLVFPGPSSGGPFLVTGWAIKSNFPAVVPANHFMVGGNFPYPFPVFAGAGSVRIAEFFLGVNEASWASYPTQS